MLEKLFQISKKGSNVKTEILAGVTTFLAMAYILAVNPEMLAATGMSFQSVFLATAISSGIATVLMGVFANYPVALAPGMGVNAFFAFTICGSMGYTWEEGLALVFVSGLLFLLISVTGLRKVVLEAIPQQLKLAIGAGIGFFIAFIGLVNGGIIVANSSTLVAFGDLSEPTVILAVFGILVSVFLLVRKIPAAVFYGLVATLIVGIIAGMAGVEGMPTLPTSFISVDFDMPTLGAFTKGFSSIFGNSNTFIALFSLLFVDFFDTAGTLVAVANRANLINEDGELENVDKAMLSDAVGTVAGAVLGTSTVTSFVESTSGVEVGGRTGLTAVTTGVCFFLSILFYPLLSVVTSAVTAPALVVVGILMAQQLGGIEWDNLVHASSAFMTVIMMVLCYSISHGIALGFITYAITMVASGKGKEIKPVVWCLIPIFIIYFIL